LGGVSGVVEGTEWFFVAGEMVLSDAAHHGVVEEAGVVAFGVVERVVEVAVQLLSKMSHTMAAANYPDLID